MTGHMSKEPIGFPFASHLEIGIAIFLFATTLALFWPARGFDYVKLDDYPYVAENRMVLGGLRGDAVRQAFTTVHEQWWLPLLWVSYMADVEIFGPGPHGHHSTNILLHAANAALLFWALFRLTGSRWRSALVAALFAWHPTRVEAVAWIAARKDVLSGLFFMLALLAYVRHAERPSARRMGWVSVWMLLGLMSKAILIVLPPILLLLDGWPLRRAKALGGAEAWKEWKPLLREKALPIALAAAFMGLNLWTHASGRAGTGQVSAAARFGLVAPNYLDYLGLAAAPIRLSLLYPENDVVSWPLSIGALVALGAATWAALRYWRKRPYWAVGWLWFLVALLPVIRGVRLGLAQYADRFCYLPLIGLGIAGGWTVAEWADRPRRRRWAVAICGLALAACAARTHAQIPRWRNSLVLLTRAAHFAPRSALIQANLGLSMLEAGQIEQGADLIGRAVRWQPQNAEYRSNLGVALQRLGNAQAALAAQDEAIRLKPDQADFHNNRGNALLALGRAEEARAAYEEALRLDPGHADANFNLGGVLFRAGRLEEARRCYESSVRAVPTRAWSWYRLGIVCEKLGCHDEAKSCVERAREIDPGIPGSGMVLMRLGMTSGATGGGERHPLSAR